MSERVNITSKEFKISFRIPSINLTGILCDAFRLMSSFFITLAVLYLMVLKDFVEIFVYSSLKISKRLIWILQMMGAIERQTLSEDFSTGYQTETPTKTLEKSQALTPNVLPQTHYQLTPIRFPSPICTINIAQTDLLERPVNESNCETLPHKATFLKRKWNILKLNRIKRGDRSLLSKLLNNDTFNDFEEKSCMNDRMNEIKPPSFEESPVSNSCFKNVFHTVKSKFKKTIPGVAYKRF